MTEAGSDAVTVDLGEIARSVIDAHLARYLDPNAYPGDSGRVRHRGVNVDFIPQELLIRFRGKLRDTADAKGLVVVAFDVNAMMADPGLYFRNLHLAIQAKGQEYRNEGRLVKTFSQAQMAREISRTLH